MPNTPDVITVAELDAMSDADFVALFPGGPAFVGLIRSLAAEVVETEPVAS